MKSERTMNLLKNLLKDHIKPIIIVIIAILAVIIAFTIFGKSKTDSSDPVTGVNNETNGQEKDATSEENSSEEDKDITKTSEEPSKDTDQTDEPEEEPEPIGPLSVLTGLPITQEAYDQRPIGIMISNIKAALPQYGISEAEVIYETLVEGGITRLFAVSQNFESDKIGPVRSSRHYFVDYALEHDAIYVHFGQSVYAKKAFKSLNIDRFYGISYLDEYLVFYDPDRVAPHSTFTSKDRLMDTWDVLDYRKEADYSELKFAFNEEDTSLESENVANRLVLDYSYYIKPELVYNEEEGVYYRSQFDKPEIDENNGIQLSFKNVIVQYADMWVMKNDPDGCMEVELIGSGEGMYITDGKMLPITWEKTDHYAPTKYYMEDGSPLMMNPGKTFISVFPSYRTDKIILE